MIATAFLGFAVLMLSGFGVAFLFRPDRMAAVVDLEAKSTSGRSDVRAVYGGLELGIAAFLIWCMLDPSRVSVGLWLTASAFGFTSLGRLVGMALDRPVSSLTVKVFIVEAATAAVALALAL